MNNANQQATYDRDSQMYASDSEMRRSQEQRNSDAAKARQLGSFRY